jgi:hypothetical protein
MLASFKSLEELGVMAGEMLAKQMESQMKEYVITKIAKLLSTETINATSQMLSPMSCSMPSFPTGKKDLLTELEKLLEQQSKNLSIVVELHPLNLLPDDNEEESPWHEEQPEELK